MNRGLRALMERPGVYRLWQAPYAERKLAPIFRHNEMSDVRRVLDVACGPGTNTQHFARSDYLGLDYNEHYIDYARRRYGRQFVVADATTYTVEPGQRFDFILVNSFFHHVDDADAPRILSHLSTLLTDDGHIHILDLVLPERPSIARALARADRGDFPRPLAAWRTLFTEHFKPIVFEPYVLGDFGVALWNMVYFKGKPKSRDRLASTIRG